MTLQRLILASATVLATINALPIVEQRNPSNYTLRSRQPQVPYTNTSADIPIVPRQPLAQGTNVPIVPRQPKGPYTNSSENAPLAVRQPGAPSTSVPLRPRQLNEIVEPAEVSDSDTPIETPPPEVSDPAQPTPYLEARQLMDAQKSQWDELKPNGPENGELDQLNSPPVLKARQSPTEPAPGEPDEEDEDPPEPNQNIAGDPIYGGGTPTGPILRVRQDTPPPPPASDPNQIIKAKRPPCRPARSLKARQDTPPPPPPSDPNEIIQAKGPGCDPEAPVPRTLKARQDQQQEGDPFQTEGGDPPADETDSNVDNGKKLKVRQDQQEEGDPFQTEGGDPPSDGTESNVDNGKKLRARQQLQGFGFPQGNSFPGYQPGENDNAAPVDTPPDDQVVRQ